ncbi:MAG: hypothetical protein NVSMB21_17900 [Vulcanimicrobiaceae bacterium]
MRTQRSALYAVAAAGLMALAGCGGGGGGSATPAPTPTPTPTPAPASVSGDMLALADSRGFNYHGSLGANPFTLTIYTNPAVNGTQTLVLGEVAGTVATALNAAGSNKLAAATFVNASGYQVQNFTLFSPDGTAFAQGALPNPQLVTNTLVLGATFSPYPGVVATVTAVGPMPGSAACPTPSALGATVQYVFMGQTYLLSYVPGCGLTQYVGNHGETFTLSSIGSYPGTGTLSVGRSLAGLSVVDTIKSIVHIVLGQGVWKSPLHR